MALMTPLSLSWPPNVSMYLWCLTPESTVAKEICPDETCGLAFSDCAVLSISPGGPKPRVYLHNVWLHGRRISRAKRKAYNEGRKDEVAGMREGRRDVREELST